MRHSWRGWILLLVAAVMSRPAWASVGYRDTSGTLVGAATDLQASGSYDGSVLTLKGEKRVVLDLLSATIKGSATSALQLQGNEGSSPGLKKKSGGSENYVCWHNGVTSPVQVRFRIPDDYLSGGAFRILLGRSGGTNFAPALDFQVFVDTNQTAFDAAATDQAAVTVTGNVNGGSPELKTLTIVTDFDALTAGQIVTLELWRDSSGSSTEDLEAYYAEFYYTARN